MEKKFYVQPECEVLKLKYESPLLSGSGEPSEEQDEGDGNNI